MLTSSCAAKLTDKAARIILQESLPVDHVDKNKKQDDIISKIGDHVDVDSFEAIWGPWKLLGMPI